MDNARIDAAKNAIDRARNAAMALHSDAHTIHALDDALQILSNGRESLIALVALVASVTEGVLPDGHRVLRQPDQRTVDAAVKAMNKALFE